MLVCGVMCMCNICSTYMRGYSYNIVHVHVGILFLSYHGYYILYVQDKKLSKTANLLRVITNVTNVVKQHNSRVKLAVY